MPQRYFEQVASIQVASIVVREGAFVGDADFPTLKE